MFHHEPLLRHDTIATFGAADDDLFNAPTAEAWAEILKSNARSDQPLQDVFHPNLAQHSYSQPMPEELTYKGSRFTAYVILQGLAVSICEAQQAGRLTTAAPLFQSYTEALLCWYTTFMSKPVIGKHGPIADTFCLMLLWHTAFMNLLASFDTLERAIGRDGPQSRPFSPQAESDVLYATQWAKSISARRCLLHAHALQKVLGAMHLDAEPAIHVPHCLFLAGIASYCYTRFQRPSCPLSTGSNTVFSSGDFQSVLFPEFTFRGAKIPTHLFGTADAAGSGAEDAVEENEQPQQRARSVVPIGAGLLCTLTDMLQRIGHWGIARKFAGTLRSLVAVDDDEGWMLT